MIACIINPASAGGKTGTRAPALIEALRGQLGNELRIHVTCVRGEAEATALRLASEHSIRTIIAVGGDGTVQEVVNGLRINGAPTSSLPTLGILSSGTGQGLAQGLNLPRGLRDQIGVITAGYSRAMDLGHVRFRDRRRTLCGRLFVNECQLGIGAAVVREVESAPKRMNGRMTFALGAFRMLFRHPNQDLTIAVDGHAIESHRVLGVVIGNGQFTGGGMNLTPGANPFDGTLDLLVMKEQSLPVRLANLRRIYSARHVHTPHFSLRPVRSLTIAAEDSVEIEADGEYLGVTPCSIEAVPAAVRVCIPREGT